MPRETISLCTSCQCMTKTISDKCGKCGGKKVPLPTSNTKTDFEKLVESLVKIALENDNVPSAIMKHKETGFWVRVSVSDDKRELED